VLRRWHAPYLGPWSRPAARRLRLQSLYRSVAACRLLWILRVRLSAVLSAALLWLPILRLLWLSVWRLSPIQQFAASQRRSRLSAALRADTKRAPPDPAGTASRGAATTSRRRTNSFDGSSGRLVPTLKAPASQADAASSAITNRNHRRQDKGMLDPQEFDQTASDCKTSCEVPPVETSRIGCRCDLVRQLREQPMPSQPSSVVHRFHPQDKPIWYGAR
jgi:hypothetical protein